MIRCGVAWLIGSNNVRSRLRDTERRASKRGFTLAPWLFSVIALPLCGCDGASDADGGDDATTSDSAAEAGASTGAADAATAGEAADQGEQGDASGTSAGDAGSSESGASDSTETGQDPVANGEPCTVDAECISQKCKETDIEGVSLCSDCKTDQECVDAGTGDACEFDFDLRYFVCATRTAGELGEPCSEEDPCVEGLMCTEIGMLGANLSVCSECAGDADCTEGAETLCSPVANPMMMGAYNACVAPASVANDGLCNPTTSGEEACAQHCGELMLGGMSLGIGACGECRTTVPEDCPEGQSCSGPSLDPAAGTLKGSVCE